ncbi:MAG: RNA polymerase sigma factor [Candidatus Aminicenantes bacterium]|nr:RNA polymerase sigma factor [Candidatus Aminicenantes bacterium]MDH5745276.1 RNA polymerase sigma factor [Candidatus Aminicenantes bacterium]
MNSEMVILLAKEGNENAFRNLYESNYEMIYRLVYRYMKSPQDAEDVMQETFIKAFKNIQSFDFNINTNFSSWIYQIGVRCSIEHLRKRKSRKLDLTDSLSTLYKEPEAHDSSPEKSTIAALTIAQLKKALHVLSPKQRVIFDLRHMQHLAIKEIAAHIQCSESTVKKHLNRAVSKLRKKLEPLWGEQ